MTSLVAYLWFLCCLQWCANGFLLNGRSTFRVIHLVKQQRRDWITDVSAVNTYIPRVGLESKVAYYGNSRGMTLQNFIHAFQLFPGLCNATKAAIWPEDRELTVSEQRFAQIALKFLNDSLETAKEAPPLRLQRIENVLKSWTSYLHRTGNSSIEKNELHSRAAKYNIILRILLDNEIAGKEVFKLILPSSSFDYTHYVGKHQPFNSSSSTSPNHIPMLNATALWIDVLQKFFNLHFEEPRHTKSFTTRNNSERNNKDKIQAHFLQLDTNDNEIRDALLNIFRFVAHSLWEDHPSVRSIDILYPLWETNTGIAFAFDC